jgi:hypothetical protein
MVYLSPRLDLNYECSYEGEKFNLKAYVEKYVQLYLKDIDLQVLTPKAKIPIMDDKLYQKSNDCGNYVFDPFFDSVQFFIKRKNNTPFERTFKIKGAPKITY